jgi:hypothetical protein
LSCGCVNKACQAAKSKAAAIAPNKLHAKGTKTSAANPAAKLREAKREKVRERGSMKKRADKQKRTEPRYSQGKK